MRAQEDRGVRRKGGGTAPDEGAIRFGNPLGGCPSGTGGDACQGNRLPPDE
ncbi:hypothetical protein [Methylobacterium flocculans]|uniref:hypothetical protein n=1 Tax=Methylobacterium flocculans TaxID=2984843 RepID=UPI0021F2586A|nr:hypothetical protein [Methylobacterium sp. FF17]